MFLFCLYIAQNSIHCSFETYTQTGPFRKKTILVTIQKEVDTGINCFPKCKHNYAVVKKNDLTRKPNYLTVKPNYLRMKRVIRHRDMGRLTTGKIGFPVSGQYDPGD